MDFSSLFMKNVLLILFFFLLIPKGNSQSDTSEKVYSYNYWIDIPSIVLGFGYNFYGQERLRNYPRLDSMDYIHLSPSDINRFDRSATRQDPDFANDAHSLSDFGLRIAPALPFLLGFDKKIRQDALNLSLLYLQMHSINATVYLASALNIRRKRPFVYNPNEIYERKSGPKSTDSFFSGHVSVVNASTFFMAKVYLDYHPEKKKWRYLYYGLASLPAIYTGYFRYKAGKHYPSDLIVGYAVGAAVGILTPELHRSRLYKKAHVQPQIGLNYFGFKSSIQFY